MLNEWGKGFENRVCVWGGGAKFQEGYLILCG